MCVRNNGGHHCSIQKLLPRYWIIRVSCHNIKSTLYGIIYIPHFILLFKITRLTTVYHTSIILDILLYFMCGPCSSVGIVTDYGLYGPGSIPGGDEIFCPSRPAPGAHPASCKMGTGSFPWVKCNRGALLTTHPLLVPRSWKSRAIPLPTLWATMGL
jgi:hypothetical protein